MSLKLYKDFKKSFKMRSKYCFYDCEEPINKIAFKGKCRIFIPPYMAYDIKGYTSKILNKPTYKDIFLLCDDYYIKSGNINDIFFTKIFLPENNIDNIDIDINNLNESLEELEKPFILDHKKVYNIEMRMEDMGDRFNDYLRSVKY